MKKILFSLISITLLSWQISFAQTTIYVHQKNNPSVITLKSVDSITFQAPSHHEPDVTMFVGGDISMLPKYEEHGNTYYDINGKKVDVLPFFQQVGLNSMRVRLFVDPTKASRENIGSGVVQDLNFVVKLGKRIKQQGFKFMLDFHYSDSWADPAQQTMPDSWKNASASALNDTLYNYTKRCLKTLEKN